MVVLSRNAPSLRILWTSMQIFGKLHAGKEEVNLGMAVLSGVEMRHPILRTSCNKGSAPHSVIQAKYHSRVCASESNACLHTQEH